MKHHFLVLFLLLIACATVCAQIPHTLNYQGTLTTGTTPVPDGNYNVTFRLYTASSGGSAAWTEAQLVATRNGVFSAILGKIVALPAAFSVPYWLSLQVGADPELSPRVEMTGVAYSMRTVTADSAVKVANNSITSASITDLAVGTSDLANTSVTAAKLSGSGSSSGQALVSSGSTVTWARLGLLAYDVTMVGSPHVASVGDTYVKLTDIKTFTKVSATSVLEVVYEGRVFAATIPSGTGVAFQLRIDDATAPAGGATSFIRAIEAGDYVPSHLTGMFPSLAAGSHTVSVWVRAFYGSATNVYLNSGGWGAQLIIKEFD